MDTQQVVNKAVGPIEKPPRYHAWIMFTNGGVQEVDADLIQVRDGVIEIRQGRTVKVFPLNNIKGYTINEP